MQLLAIPLFFISFLLGDSLHRFKGTQLIDKITSTYNTNSNQLNYLQDAEPAYNIGNQSSDNYKYNAIGALIQDNELGINTITWNRFNKAQSVQQGNKKFYYAYSPLGYKLIEKAAKYSNYYVYDATGNVQAQYRISGDSVFLSHHVLYGAKRLGLVANSFFIATKPNRAVFGPENLTITSIPLSRFNHRRPLGRYYTLELGNKQYELTNHLGNVQAVVSDRKLPVLKNGFIAKYQADLQSSKEYYPFGMVLYDSSLVSYNYGFNGKPHDFGISSWQDYGFRFYDTRFPRFLSVDPLAGKYPSMTPYVPFANNPILFVDPDGREIRIYGIDAEKAFSALQTKTALKLSYDINTRKITATGKARNKTDKILLKAIKDKEVFVNLYTIQENSVQSQDGSIQPVTIGFYDGSKTKTENINGTPIKLTETIQYINMEHSQKAEEASVSNQGIDVFHEIIESYFGGKNDPGGVFNLNKWQEAHNKALSKDKSAPELILNLNTKTGKAGLINMKNNKTIDLRPMTNEEKNAANKH